MNVQCPLESESHHAPAVGRMRDRDDDTVAGIRNMGCEKVSVDRFRWRGDTCNPQQGNRKKRWTSQTRGAHMASAPKDGSRVPSVYPPVRTGAGRS